MGAHAKVKVQLNETRLTSLMQCCQFFFFGIILSSKIIASIFILVFICP